MTLDTLTRNPLETLPAPVTPVHSGGELEPVVMFSYGDYHNNAMQHPRNEDMFPGRQDYQAFFRERFGMEMHIAHRTSPVRDGNVLPEVEVDTQPVFTPRQGGLDTLDNPNYGPGTIATSALVVDRDVENFENPYTDGPKKARGNGLPDWQGFNHHSVQQGGNDKEWAHDHIIVPSGAALSTFRATHDGVAEIFEQYGDVPVVTKPIGGANGKGVVKHKSLMAVLDAMDEDPELKTHLLQPFVDQTAHIPGLKPIYEADRTELEKYNKPGERLKEVRMSIGAYYDENKGAWSAWAYPVLIASTPGAVLLKGAKNFVALSPESIPQESSMYRKTMQAIGNVVIESGARQFYGSADWTLGVDPNGDPIECINDMNLRSPYMFPRSLFARNALMNMWGITARQNYERSGGRR